MKNERNALDMRIRMSHFSTKWVICLLNLFRNLRNPFVTNQAFPIILNDREMQLLDCEERKILWEKEHI